MKKLFLSIVAVAAFMSCDAQHSLTLNLDDIKGDTVILSLISRDFRSLEKQETLVRQNGVFTYDFTGDKARLCQVAVGKGQRAQRFNITLVPGEQGTLTGSLKKATWSGTAFYSDLAKLDEKTSPLEKQMNELTQDFYTKINAGANKDSLQKAIMPKYGALQAQMQEAQMKFIKENPKSGVSASLLMGVEDLETAYGYLDESVKTGVFSLFTDAVKNEIEKQQAQKKAMEKLAPGNPAPDFTLNDINGKPLALSSLRGKYVIIDFWGSWCGWCIKGMPEMKKYYEKYNGKLEILGVDCNDTEEKWKAAVEKHQLPWKHVYNPRSNREVLTKYAVSGFPTKVLVDPKGNIVKLLAGEDPAFYQLLDEVLAK